MLYIVNSEANHGFAAIKEYIRAHLKYLSSLETSGKLFMAGPLFNEEPDSWSDDGLLIYDVSSQKRLEESPRTIRYICQE